MSPTTLTLVVDSGLLASAKELLTESGFKISDEDTEGVEPGKVELVADHENFSEMQCETLCVELQELGIPYNDIDFCGD